MTTKNNGSMGAAGIVCGMSNIAEKMSKFILGRMNPDKFYNVSIGHSNTLENGEKLKDLIQKGHKNINSIYLLDMGCALGVHAGPGSLATAIQLV